MCSSWWWRTKIKASSKCAWKKCKSAFDYWYFSYVNGLHARIYFIYLWYWYSLYFFICSDKDWEDIKFGVDNQVDFYAVSFVKDARVVHELKDYLRSNFFFFLNFHFMLYSIYYYFLGYTYFTYCFWFKLFQTSSVDSNADIHVIVKIESADSIPNLHSIISASDGVSVNIMI